MSRLRGSEKSLNVFLYYVVRDSTLREDKEWWVFAIAINVGAIAANPDRTNGTD